MKWGIFYLMKKKNITEPGQMNQLAWTTSSKHTCKALTQSFVLDILYKLNKILMTY